MPPVFDIFTCNQLISFDIFLNYIIQMQKCALEFRFSKIQRDEAHITIYIATHCFYSIFLNCKVGISNDGSSKCRTSPTM